MASIGESSSAIGDRARLLLRLIFDRAGVAMQFVVTVESRTGAVVWGQWPTLRFPSPLIELDVPISGIQLSDQFHREGLDAAIRGKRSRRSRPHSP
jgi:hypothetical protein